MHNSINYAMENYSVIKQRDDCSDCITPCLNYYRYSSLWYSYYYDVYYDCVYYGFINCGGQAYLYADHMININFCEPACDDVCNPCSRRSKTTKDLWCRKIKGLRSLSESQILTILVKIL